MRSNYKQLGKYIRQVDERNTELGAQTLLGVSIEKVFMPSIANIIGTDMSTYKKVRRGQFAYGPVTSRNANKISIALQDQHDEAIVSQAYMPFEVIDTKELLPEYLMMWFRRPEFDRYARFMSHGSAREIFEWDEMCKVKLPVPHPDKQKEIVKEYNAIVNRIHLNNQLIQKLEETAQAIYKQWFVDFEFPDENGQPYKSSGGEMIWNAELEKEVPKGWDVDDLMTLIKYKKGFAFKSENYTKRGVPVFRVSDFTDKSINITHCHYLDESIAKELTQYELKTNDIIITTVGSWPDNPASVVGKIIIVPELADKGLLNQNAVRIRAKNPRRQVFLYFRLKSKEYSEFVISGAQGSANQASVTLDHIFSFKILVPDNKGNLFSLLNYVNDSILKINTENYYLQKISNLFLSKLATIEN